MRLKVLIIHFRKQWSLGVSKKHYRKILNESKFTYLNSMEKAKIDISMGNINIDQMLPKEVKFYTSDLDKSKSKTIAQVVDLILCPPSWLPKLSEKE